MTTSPRQQPWSLDDIAWDAIDAELIRDDDALFLLVCSASFVESGSDTYTGNLVARFADDAEVSAWLRGHWEPEELQHGRALRTYVRRVWPTRGQEMAARCIVEMGTTTYYQALNAATAEPVLRDLAWRIRCDEVRHYKHFHAFFHKYREAEHLGRRHVLAALVRRALELRNEDAAIALRHVAAWRRRSRLADGAPADIPSDSALKQQARGVVSRHLPMELAVRMAIKPLRLGPGMQRWLAKPLAALGAGIVRP